MHICNFSDPRHYRISVGGRIFTFEWSDQFGPFLIGKRGEELKAKPTNAFLDAVTLWFRQGKKVDADGLCEWWHKPEEILEHLGGRNFLVVGWKEPVRGS